MADEQTTPEQRIDDDTSTDDVPGTAAGDPVAGAEISEEDKERAVEPDDDALEVDGPQAGHA
ncbi:hypothetical protein [Nocardioides flavescens]|uniref:Uncharacterized protein n=1 Tax=Nocardioides flavescens TaxID=2691959 RepID=A0A6L7F3J8_9ACTN|nr:hypothetical protein [Nocardioides flavescens]MXG91812.1 hypothetical protein [Nocardioides flavescens]